MPDQIQEIRDKLDIVDVVSSYVPLKKAGRNYKALCPFHTEKTPSFMVSPELQIYKCFGCGKGGNIYNFVMEIEGVEFREALQMMADRAGIKLERLALSPEDEKRERLYKINELANQFYKFLLTEHKIGKKALDYLHDREITEESVKTFEMGYAPNSWDSLGKYLLSKRHSLSDIIRAGLVLPKEFGRGFYDRFRGRIIFVLRDTRNRAVGFSGRTLVGDEAKYINTPETEIFKKRHFLYGLNLTRKEIKQTRQAVVVEGEFDLISPYQAGTKNIVASKGTALTEGQIALLKRLADDLLFCYDADIAGDEAAKRGIQMAEEAGLNVKVINLPTGKDPDECVQKNLQGWKKAIENAISVYDFYFKNALGRYNIKTALGKKKAAKELLPIIASIPDPVEKDHYTKRLASELGVSETSLLAALRSFSRADEQEKAVEDLTKRFEEASAPRVIQEYVLALLLKSPLDQAQAASHRLGQKDFSVPKLQNIFVAFKEYLSGRKRAFNIKSFRDKLSEEEQLLLDELYLQDFSFLSENEGRFSEEISRMVDVLKRQTVRRELNELSRRIKEAEAGGEKERLEELRKEFKVLSEKLN